MIKDETVQKGEEFAKARVCLRIWIGTNLVGLMAVST